MTPQPCNFLFTTFDGGGNVAPVMNAVERLLTEGHRVRVACDESVREEAIAAGAVWLPWNRAPNKAKRSRQTDPPDWTVPRESGIAMLFEHFIGATASAYAQDTLDLLRDEPADLVVSCEMLLGVAAACEARTQKLAFLSTSIALFPCSGMPPFGSGLRPADETASAGMDAAIAAARLRSDAALPGLNSARSSLGLPPLAQLTDQLNALNRYFLGTARAFDFSPARLPGQMRYVGPLLRDPAWAGAWNSPWRRDDPRPLVMVGFSTSFQDHASCVQRVIDACARLPLRLLVTLGGALRPDELTAAPDVAITSSASHHQVMRDAAIVVTHGGHGTLMTALAHGLPVLVLPHGRDQDDNAARVVARGVGLALPNTASVAQIEAALRTLADDPQFRHRAQQLGTRIRQEIRDSTLIAELEALAREKPDHSRRTHVTT